METEPQLLQSRCFTFWLPGVLTKAFLQPCIFSRSQTRRSRGRTSKLQQNFLFLLDVFPSSTLSLLQTVKTSVEARARGAAAAAFRPIHPPLLGPIREDRQVNKCAWKSSSSRRRGGTEPAAPLTPSSLARCRLEQTSINNLEVLRLLSRNLCSVKRRLIE